MKVTGTTLRLRLTVRRCSPSLSEAEGSVLSLSKGSPRLLGPLAEGGDPAVAGEPGEGAPADYFEIELAGPGDGIIRHPVGTGQPSTCGSVPGRMSPTQSAPRESSMVITFSLPPCFLTHSGFVWKAGAESPLPGRPPTCSGRAAVVLSK